MEEHVNSLQETSRKRKMTESSELLGLPFPKQICYATTLTAECDSSSTKSLDAEELYMHMRIPDALPVDQGVDSAQDSNSFGGESSAGSDTKLHADGRMLHHLDEASTSRACSGGERIENGHYAPLHDTENLVQHRAEHLGNSWPEESPDAKCQMYDELDDFVYSDEVPPNLCTLPSEGWTINEETQLGARKPTIDQEFEQYFSTLML